MINEHDIKDMWPSAITQSDAHYYPNVTWSNLDTVNTKQIGGDHYKKYGDLQPWDVVLAWNLGYLDGTALKYIARWKDKGGIADIEKAIHFLEKLIEVNKGK